MDAGFHELHATVNCAIGFTYKYFSAYPGCVIGQVGRDVRRFGYFVTRVAAV